MKSPNRTREALHELAKADATAARLLANALYEHMSMYTETADPELVLPICREIQAKVQAVANRVEAHAALQEQEAPA